MRFVYDVHSAPVGKLYQKIDGAEFDPGRLRFLFRERRQYVGRGLRAVHRNEFFLYRSGYVPLAHQYHDVFARVRYALPARGVGFGNGILFRVLFRSSAFFRLSTGHSASRYDNDGNAGYRRIRPRRFLQRLRGPIGREKFQIEIAPLPRHRFPKGAHGFFAPEQIVAVQITERAFRPRDKVRSMYRLRSAAITHHSRIIHYDALFYNCLTIKEYNAMLYEQ